MGIVAHKKITSKQIDILLDIAWSELVKLKANNRCEYCGSPNNLQSHHIHTRKKKSTRWHIENGVCLCEDHHVYSPEFSAHRTEKEFMEWLENDRGEAFITDLERLSNATLKLFIHEKQELLDQLNTKIKLLK